MQGLYLHSCTYLTIMCILMFVSSYSSVCFCVGVLYNIFQLRSVGLLYQIRTLVQRNITSHIQNTVLYIRLSDFF